MGNGKLPIAAGRCKKPAVSSPRLATHGRRETAPSSLRYLLVGNSDRSYCTNEIVRVADADIGSVQGELQRLETVGFIKARKPWGGR